MGQNVAFGSQILLLCKFKLTCSFTVQHNQFVYSRAPVRSSHVQRSAGTDTEGRGQ